MAHPRGGPKAMAAQQAAAEREREQQMALMQTIVAQEEVKQAQSSAMRLTERCFADCVHNFRTRTLDSKEELCASRCIDKYRGAYDRLMREWNVMILEKKQEAQETREV